MKNNLSPSETELILAHILKKSREYVLTHPELRLSKAQKQQFRKLVNRRKKHEPLAYILGHKEFYNLDFKVNKNTLIPRPETEILVEEVIKSNPKNSTIIDIGTGSGNIIISLAKNIENDNQFFGIDISQKALGVAKLNSKKNKTEKKIKFIKSNLLDNKKLLGEIKKEKIIIAANLPYLSKEIYSSTMPDVKNFEPKSALLSGIDGLDHYKKLLSQIKNIFDSCPPFSVHCFLEISPEQKSKINNLAKKYFPAGEINFQKDLAGKWRVAMVEM